MKAFSEWYFGAVSSGLERGLVLLGILSCVSCPDKSDFTFNLRVRPGLCSSSSAPLRSYPSLIQPSPALPSSSISIHSPALSSDADVPPFTSHFSSLFQLPPLSCTLFLLASQQFTQDAPACSPQDQSLPLCSWPVFIIPVSHWSHLAVRSVGDEVNY